MTYEKADKKGLIRESYNISPISAQECRSIFLDWVLSMEEDCDLVAAARLVWERYAKDRPEHPMTQLLSDTMAARPIGGANRRRRKSHQRIKRTNGA